MKKGKLSRREFMAAAGMVTVGVATGAGTLNAATYRSVQGANDRINLGFIGIGNRTCNMTEIVMGS